MKRYEHTPSWLLDYHNNDSRDGSDWRHPG
jgi:hypothetical protein